MWSIEAYQLSKSYGRVASLVQCNLQIACGTVFGLLGPNGAGKSTLIRTLLGFIKPTSGSAAIAGFDICRQSLQARRQVSYLPGDARLMRSMRGDALLKLFGGLHPYGSYQHAQAVAVRLQLDCSRRVMFMSTGMRQKLAIAIALGCRAPVVVLDEPTANLDPNVRGEVVKLINEVRGEGRTVLISSHIFSDIDDTCDQVAIMRDGRIVANQAMPELQQSHIVTACLNAATLPGDESWRSAFETQALVTFLQATLAADGSRQIEFHLRGQPQQWLAWLERQPLRDMSIQRGGISAVYQRYHRSVPEA